MASYYGTTFVRSNGYQKVVLPYCINTEAERDTLFTTRIELTLKFGSVQPSSSSAFIFDVLNWNYESFINSSTTRASLVYNAGAKSISWGVLDSSPTKSLTGYVKTDLDKFTYTDFEVTDKLKITFDFLNKIIRFNNLTKSTSAEYSISDLVFSTVTKSRRQYQNVTLLAAGGGSYENTTDKLRADIFRIDVYENDTLKEYYSPYKSDTSTGALVRWTAADSLVEIDQGNTNKNPFGVGVGRAMNLRSFIDLVVDKFKNRDEEFLTDFQKNQLKEYILYGITEDNLKKLINYKSAYDIYRKIAKLKGSNYSESYTGSKYKVALSESMARCFIDSVFDDLYNYFTTFDYFDTDDMNYYDIVFVGAPTTTMTFQGTLHGGGGGGGGSCSGDGDKNASYTVTGGNGGSGTSSSMTIGNTTYVAAGGAGGAGSSKKVGGNPAFGINGNKGSDGQVVNISQTITGGTKIHLDTVGKGGGGGGAAVATAGGTTGGVVYTGGAGSGTAGGNATIGANEWSGEDYIFGGGGGDGANYFEDNTTTGGTSGASGPVASVTDYSSTELYPGSEANSTHYGGEGGYLYTGYNHINDQPSQSYGLGLGGTGGVAVYKADVYNLANGGNGGNAGGFAITSSSQAATALYARVSH